MYILYSIVDIRLIPELPVACLLWSVPVLKLPLTCRSLRHFCASPLACPCLPSSYPIFSNLLYPCQPSCRLPDCLSPFSQSPFDTPPCLSACPAACVFASLPAFLPFFLSFSLLSCLSHCYVSPYPRMSPYLFPALPISGIYPCLSICIPAFLHACPFACPTACACSLSTRRCPEAEFLDVTGTKALRPPCYLESHQRTDFTLHHPPPPSKVVWNWFVM